MKRKVLAIGLMFLLSPFVGNVSADPVDSSQIERLERRLEELESREREKYSKYKKGEEEVQVYFKNGLKMRTADNEFQFQVGGRIMYDWGFFNEDSKFISAFGNQQDGSRFRRVRLFMAGQVYNAVQYKWDIDVDGGASGVTFKDMYISIPHIPIVGNFRVGHFKRPASLDSVNSSKYLTFIERSLTNTFFKTRNVGFAFFNQHLDQRLTWFTFLNKTTGERPPDLRADGDWNVTSRLTGLPYLSEDGKDWLHLGVSYSYEAALNNLERFRGARDTEITSTFLDTGTIDVEKSHIVGLEGALNLDQFGVQGEYVTSYVDRKGRQQGQLDAFYVQGSWYVTGEHRNYHKKSGSIGRFKPNQNFSWDKDWSKGNGLGALQLAVRYAELDLNDGQAGIAGGEQQSLTLGVNWELNPMARVMYNYVHADFTSGIGADNGTLITNLIRFQVDF
jgi:phosphate-selective porin OprO and OprP